MRRAAKPLAHGGDEISDADRLGVGDEEDLVLQLGGEARAISMAEARFSIASSERRLSSPAKGSGIGVLASVARLAILPLTPRP